jgi:hypothetical protein
MNYKIPTNYNKISPFSIYLLNIILQTSLFARLRVISNLSVSVKVPLPNPVEGLFPEYWKKNQLNSYYHYYNR